VVLCSASVAVLFPVEAGAQVAEGDGVYFYGLSSDTMPYAKAYDAGTNSFMATTTTVTGGAAIQSVIKSSPNAFEMVAGYVNASGVLQVMCFDGVTWSNEWSVTVGGTGTTRRLDIAYETSTGDVMILYSTNTGTTNELAYRTKSGSAGCGTANWSSATNLDPVRTSGIVQWVKIASDPRATSTLMTAIWADANSDLSAMTWSGSAWGNEHTAALETALEVATAAQDVESFDVAYEAQSGDVMVVWGSGGNASSNGAYYGVCTGGTASCTWGSIRTAMPTFTDDATHMSIAADPLSDQILYASTGNAGADLQGGVWSGSAWTNVETVDASGNTVAYGRRQVGTAWLNNGGTKRGIVTYADSASNAIDWVVIDGTTWTVQTDFTAAQTVTNKNQMHLEVNPFDGSELVYILSQPTLNGFGKRLRMDSGGSFTWTEPDAGIIASNLASNLYRPWAFAYWRYIPLYLKGDLYIDAGVTLSTTSKSIKAAVGTTSPAVYTATSSAAGEWIFYTIDFDEVSTTTQITLWLDSDADDATTLLQGFAGSSVSDIPLYYNHTIAHGVSTTSVITMGDFVYDSSDDVDILYATDTTGSTTVAANFLITQGTTVSPSSLVVPGSFVNSGIFDANNGILTLTGSTETIDGVLIGTSAFNELIITGSYTMLANASTTDLTIQSGGSLVSPNYLTIEDDFTNSGTFDSNNGLLHFVDKYGDKSFSGIDVGGLAAGTSSVSVQSSVVNGNYLYVGKAANATACSQDIGSAFGCEIMVFDISSSTNPIYVAGLDVSGSATGTGNLAVNDLMVDNNYLYAGKAGTGTACSQTAGSAIGCEIMVFDISSSTNPIYVAGLDVSGSATGTGNLAVNDLMVDNNYLYAGKAGNTTACSQDAGSALGCELMIFDISSSTYPSYLAGLDSRASTTGTGITPINSLASAGGFLYIGLQSSFVSSCSETAGAAGDCEFQLYDLSSSTNPILLAARDTSGNNSGTSNIGIRKITLVGNYLYVSKVGSASPCSQSAGSASGCELMVFDISSSTNPIYKAGRDASGSTTGTGNATTNALEVEGDYLYLGKVANATACSQTVGAALGCEIMVFDISSSTDPTYIAGRDVSGDATGTGNLAINSITPMGNYLYVGKAGSGTACSQVVGSAIGCEIMVFEHFHTWHVLSGNLIGTSALNDVTLENVVVIDDEMEVNDLSATAELVTFPEIVTVAGDYSNAGTILFVPTAQLNFDGTSAQNIDGNLVSGSALPNVTFSGTGLKTIVAMASTSLLVIDSDAEVVSTEALTVAGDYTNAGDFTAGASVQVYGDYVNTGSSNLGVNNLNVGPVSSDFVSSIDVGGLAAGTSSVAVQSSVVSGNYIYVGKAGNATACSQTAGSAVGCELMVFDVSSTTNPAYVAGRDVSGNATGTSVLDVNSLTLEGNYLYVGKAGNATACSQDIGSAIGCEIMVFDISSSTDPVYVSGRDAGGALAGVFNIDVNNMAINGNYLYVGKGADSTSCSQTAGSADGCELMVFDISSSTDPTYIAGRDASGSATGAALVSISFVTASNNYLYAGKSVHATACSQTAGSAIGCEIMVFDISSSTDPTYIAGRDISGSAAGTANTASVSTINISENYVYVGKTGNTTACSQTAGSAVGCELMVFDVSSTTNPTYVAGRDVSGDATGVGNLAINALSISNDNLYIGTAGNATACSQAVGSATGCELMVFDISSSTNPVYVAGRDTSGDSVGVGTNAVNNSVVVGDYLYALKAGNTTACSQTAGSAVGCELMVFDITANLSGNLIGTSALGNLTTAGRVSFEDNASTTNFTIEGGVVTAPEHLSVAGNYQNNSVFNSNSGEVILTGASKTIAGNLTGVSAFNDVTVTGSYTVASSAASTTNLTIGASGSLVAPNTLAVARDFSNSGSFDSNSGTVYLGPNTDEILQYVAGRDTGGADDGVQTTTIWDFAIKDSYLFVGKGPNSTACSQTAGSAIGCELQVYDISSSTNPVYVAGRDLDGSASGTGSVLQIVYLLVHGNTLYVAKAGDSTACSQTAGSAIGCELMVYDITNPTNPTYVTGLDADGTVTGANDISVQELAIKDNFLYVARNGNSTACSQTLPATGCEIQVFDISSSTNPVYLAGRDLNGSATGATTQNGLTLTIDSSEQYLYVGKSNNVGACSQVVGSATGCELQVYDISSSTNPTYVAGRDADGSSDGTIGEGILSLVLDGDYLFVGKQSNPTACSQTAGSADGCEVMIYDISTRANPTYVAGRDTDASLVGTEDLTVNRLFVHEGLLYVGKNSSSTPCSTVAGSAAGCELQVYDVTNPVSSDYIFGLDADMATDGTGQVNGVAFQVYNDVMYFGRSGLVTACSQVVGSAQGCEIVALQMNVPSLVGGFGGANALNNVIVAGRTAMSGVVQVQDLTILTSTSSLSAPTTLTLTGNLINNGTFGPGGGEVVLSGANHTLTGTTTFNRLTKNATGAATTTFEAGALYTINNTWTFSGNSSTPHELRSSNPGEYWYIDPQGEVTLSYLDVEDSNNINVSTVYCTTGCIEGTNNVNWLFELPVVLTLSSEADYHFYAGAATTTLSSISLSESDSPIITTTNDIRLSIATTSTDFYFDTTNTTLSFTGSASGKVSTTVSYEDAGATLVIDVTTNFAAEDTLAISGIEVGSFGAATAATSSLALYTGGDVDGTPDALDDKIIHLTGSLLLDEHTLGQVANEFSFANKTDQAFFAFNLTGVGEVMTVTDTVLTLSGIQGVTTDKLSGFKLYRDINSDRALDGGDIQLDGAGILTINGQHGAITFSADFVASTSANYIVVGSTAGIEKGDSVVFSLSSTGLTATGDVSSYLPYVVNTVETIQHTRANSGGGSSHTDRIGGAPPAGDGDVGGGGSDGGGEAGEEVEGANIVSNPNYIKPTATGDIHNEWTNGANAYDSDGVYATVASTNLRQTYNGFEFGIPGGNTIQGIDVKIDASGTTAAGTIDVAISWDGGGSFTSAKATPTLSGTDVVYTVGGPADTWGRSWSASEFSTTNFRLRVTAQTSANTLRLDALQIQVYHQAGGGGSGGGGGI